MSNHLLLWGSQGTGKSSIARLLPTTIEEASFSPKIIHASEIKRIDELIAKMNFGRGVAPFYQGKYGRFYLVVEELAFNDQNCSKFWVEIERIQSNSMVIITTNHPMEIDRSIRSRCQDLEIKAASPEQFLPRAKWILAQEGLDIDDDDLLNILTEVEHHHDNRKYLQRLELVVGIIGRRSKRLPLSQQKQ